MKTSTFPMNNENEAIALVKFFTDCGLTASRKGNVVKASGDASLLSHLFNKFVTIALI